MKGKFPLYTATQFPLPLDSSIDFNFGEIGTLFSSFISQPLRTANLCSIVSSSFVSLPYRLVPIVDLMLAVSNKSCPGSKQRPSSLKH